MLKRIAERVLIKVIKQLKIDLLPHAHIQQGVGHNTYLSGEDFVIDHYITKILKREPNLIFDVGANTGEYAKKLIQRFKNCTIHCFEPVIANYNSLLKNVPDKNVICHHLALGKQEGSIKLFKGANDLDGSMITAYKATIENIFISVGKITDTIECQLSTIDSICNEQIKEIDFLKIDVEGHELEVLKGAAKMIKDNKINIIQFEFNEFNIFSKSFLWDFYETLPNYDFYRILPRNELLYLGAYSSVNEIFRYQNILAVNKSLKYTHAF